MLKRMKRMERGIERKEREKKRNLVFKGVKEEKRNIKEELLRICKVIRMEIKIKEMKEMKARKEERGKMVIVRIRSKEIKKIILENKRRLKGKDM